MNYFVFLFYLGNVDDNDQNEKKYIDYEEEVDSKARYFLNESDTDLYWLQIENHSQKNCFHPCESCILCKIKII